MTSILTREELTEEMDKMSSDDKGYQKTELHKILKKLDGKDINIYPNFTHIFETEGYNIPFQKNLIANFQDFVNYNNYNNLKSKIRPKIQINLKNKTKVVEIFHDRELQRIHKKFLNAIFTSIFAYYSVSFPQYVTKFFQMNRSEFFDESRLKNNLDKAILNITAQQNQIQIGVTNFINANDFFDEANLCLTFGSVF